MKIGQIMIQNYSIQSKGVIVIETEKQVETHLKKQCKKQNIFCEKLKFISCNGAPDRILIKNGTVLFLELKRNGEEPRKNQKALHKQMKSYGAIVDWTDSKQGVNEILEKYFGTD